MSHSVRFLDAGCPRACRAEVAGVYPAYSVRTVRPACVDRLAQLRVPFVDPAAAGVFR